MALFSSRKIFSRACYLPTGRLKYKIFEKLIVESTTKNYITERIWAFCLWLELPVTGWLLDRKTSVRSRVRITTTKNPASRCARLLSATQVRYQHRIKMLSLLGTNTATFYEYYFAAPRSPSAECTEYVFLLVVAVVRPPRRYLLPTRTRLKR